jgi:hypothetical protein
MSDTRCEGYEADSVENICVPRHQGRMTAASVAPTHHMLDWLYRSEIDKVPYREAVDRPVHLRMLS